ncbi:hypothetical protein JXA34_03660 [Patescibacteria group bacterium]|nr:hypothetical protein [Patescibacteria group bacterium]
MSAVKKIKKNSLSYEQKNVLTLGPLFLTLIPPLWLLSNNIGLMSLLDISGLLATFLFSTGITLVAVKYVVKDTQRTSLVTTIIIFLFFCYSMLNTSLMSFFPLLPPEFIKVLTLIIYIPILLIGFKFRFPDVFPLWKFNQFLNIVLGTLVALSMYDIVHISISENIPIHPKNIPSNIDKPFVSDNTYPDIYYIILDAHSRADKVEEIFGSKSTTILVDELKKRDFYVAENSVSNYHTTLLSLSSSLNMNYLHNLVEKPSSDRINYVPFKNLINNCSIQQILEEHSYETINVKSKSMCTNITAHTSFLYPKHQFNEAESRLIEMTPLLDLGFGEILKKQMHTGIEYEFAVLPKVALKDEATFTFAHILSPHPPFVFSSTGEMVDNIPWRGYKEAVSYKGLAEEYLAGYKDQVSYIDTLILETIDLILKNSKQKPIIIIQADHGSGYRERLYPEDYNTEIKLKEKMSILNAIYFPDNNYELLYDNITPVNTFRVILNKFFGKDMELLEDKSYQTTCENPYAYRDVTEIVKK